MGVEEIGTKRYIFPGEKAQETELFFEALNDIDARIKALFTGIVLSAEKYTTPTHTQPSIGATTTEALASNANRLYALLENDSNETIYLKLGAAAVLNQGIRLNANGGNYEMSKLLGKLYTGAINAICATGGKTLLVLEGV